MYRQHLTITPSTLHQFPTQVYWQHLTITLSTLHQFTTQVYWQHYFDRNTVPTVQIPLRAGVLAAFDHNTVPNIKIPLRAGVLAAFDHNTVHTAPFTTQVYWGHYFDRNTVPTIQIPLWAGVLAAFDHSTVYNVPISHAGVLAESLVRTDGVRGQSPVYHWRFRLHHHGHSCCSLWCHRFHGWWVHSFFLSFFLTVCFPSFLYFF